MTESVDPSSDLRENGRLAWLALVYGSDRAHGGNKGYGDEVERVYSYDSLVQNYTRIREGDLLLLTGKGGLLGLARIARIVVRDGTKELSRCPKCRTTGYHARKRAKPTYCCKNGHEFSEPVIERVECVLYRAELERFVPAAHAMSLAELRYGRTDSANQVAVGPVDLALIRHSILAKVPAAAGLLSSS